MTVNIIRSSPLSMLPNLTLAVGMRPFRFLLELDACHGLALVARLVLWMHGPERTRARLLGPGPLWRIAGNRPGLLLLLIGGNADHVLLHAVHDLVVTDVLHPLLFHHALLCRGLDLRIHSG